MLGLACPSAAAPSAAVPPYGTPNATPPCGGPRAHFHGDPSPRYQRARSAGLEVASLSARLNAFTAARRAAGLPESGCQPSGSSATGGPSVKELATSASMASAGGSSRGAVNELSTASFPDRRAGADEEGAEGGGEEDAKDAKLKMDKLPSEPRCRGAVRRLVSPPLASSSSGVGDPPPRSSPSQSLSSSLSPFKRSSPSKKDAFKARNDVGATDSDVRLACNAAKAASWHFNGPGPGPLKPSDKIVPERPAQSRHARPMTTLSVRTQEHSEHTNREQPGARQRGKLGSTCGPICARPMTHRLCYRVCKAKEVSVGIIAQG
jgi:hypothetical protein